MAESLLSLGGVSRVYGTDVEVHALRNVSIDIRTGDLLSIVGPSGSGKSTLLGLLGLLDLPSSGVVTVQGRGATSLGDAARSRLRGEAIGFVFQQFHLIPHLTALANVETALLYRGLSARERRRRAFEALERLGLGDRHDHRPVQLSGGEQQRVAIARAIVPEPLVVLADEPTGALDTANAAKIMEVFRGLQSPERAVCIVTHNRDLARSTPRQISMLDGEVVADDEQATSGVIDQ